MKQRPTRFVGLEVATEPLDLACRPVLTRWRVTDDRAGIAQCLAHLRPLKPALLVRDATGGWQGSLVAALAVAQRPVAVVNPRHIRDVAKATGPWATTDALAAGVLAHCAEAVHPTPRPRPDEMPQQRDALRQRRRPRLELWGAERQRMALAHPTVRDRLARHMHSLQRLLDETAAEISPLIRTTQVWRETDD